MGVTWKIYCVVSVKGCMNDFNFPPLTKIPPTTFLYYDNGVKGFHSDIGYLGTRRYVWDTEYASVMDVVFAHILHSY